MSWKSDYKSKFLEVTRRVLRHDAPDEIKYAVDGHNALGHAYNETLGQYVEDHVGLIMNDPGWPKQVRKNPIMCPVTGEESVHPFGLSYRAWELIEEGVEHERQKEAESADRNRYAFYYSWGHRLTEGSYRIDSDHYARYEQLHQTGDYYRSEDLSNLVFKLIKREPSRYTLTKGEAPEDRGWIWLPVEPFTDDLIGRDRHVFVIELQPAEAELVRRVITFVSWKVRETERTALRDGSNLLYKLATEPDAVERFNAVQFERQKEG